MKKTGYLTASQSRRMPTLMLCAAVSAGMIAGSVYGAAHPHGLPLILHQCFLPGESGTGFLTVTRNTFFSSALFIAAAYLAGLSALGQPVGIALLIYRGFGIGASSASLYSSEGAGAAFKVTLQLMPAALALTGVAILAVRELLRTSTAVLRLWTAGELKDEKLIDLRLYSVKYAVLLLLSAIISLADGAVYSAVSASV